MPPAYDSAGRVPADAGRRLSPRRSAGGGTSSRSTVAQLGGASGQAQPAHPAARAQRPRRDHGVVVEPAGELDPGAVARQLVDAAARRRRPARSAPHVLGVAEHRPQRLGERRLGAPRTRRARRCGPACAASSSTSRLAGSSASEAASSSVAPDRRSSWASSVPRATSMRWCIRSSRLAVQLSHRPTTSTSDQHAGREHQPAHHTPPATTVS